jgi:endoglucanase
MTDILPTATRRTTLAGLAGTMLAGRARAADPVSFARLPRWRGFNLLEKFTLAGNAPYRERDFDFIAANGFNYVRLPLDYRIWTDADGTVREAPLQDIDQAVAFARGRGIHITLCLHRAPGYCINPPKEPLDLWGDGPDGDKARTLFARQWGMLAARYRTVPAAALSFNLVNEPPAVTEEQYLRVAQAAVDAIRAEDPDRLVIADGRGGGRNPTPALAALKIAQAGRGYEPFHLTHYRAGWVSGSDTWPVPTWPLQTADGVIDQATLWRETIEPWQRLEKTGTGVFIGEWGVYNKTPHDVALRWMQACLENWKKAGWGWCLWNLRGDFGPLDSKRSDVAYATHDGHEIDIEMLELLQRY